MIRVDEALDQLFQLTLPLAPETVDLADAAGRVLRVSVTAGRDQPPFAASAMDGYAVQSDDAVPGAVLRVVGVARAGAGFGGTVTPGTAARIFTGAPVPEGADRVVIQEDVTAGEGEITIGNSLGLGPHIRPAGDDFAKGARFAAPLRLGPAHLALLAAMNANPVEVSRRPVVAIIATGDELVMPGETPGPDQIIASNGLGIAALVAEEGGIARMLPIARDNAASLKNAFRLAEGADVIVTIGGASVGDHDIVGPVAAELGMKQKFYKVAMRPGKPLMAGQLNGALLIGVPGNPVSALVCGEVFLRPVLRAMQGLAARPRRHRTARLGVDLPANGPREHYMRARLAGDGTIAPLDRQDSALLTVMTGANALLIRPVEDAARKAGSVVPYLPLG